MRWLVLAGFAAVAAMLCLPGQAAEPGATPSAAASHSAAASAKTDAGPEKITFEAYREWRLRWNERRGRELSAALAASDLPAARKARLTQVKGYYDWLAGLSDAERDRRFRERFDRIDTDHDGTIDRAERAAWHDKKRALFSHAHAGASP